MNNTYFHNSKKIVDTPEKKNLHLAKVQDKKIIVDINKILNRVKNNKHEEQKSKIIFFSIGIFLLTTTGFFILIIK